MTDAIGSPVANDFFDPQNSIAMVSARLNPIFWLAFLVSHSMKATKIAAKATRNTRSHREIEDQIPSTTPLEKAEYTTIAIEPRSTTLVALLCATLPTQRRVS